jgi:ABC-2 type transport system permease protein
MNAILSLRRSANRYGAILALAPKIFLAYRGWVWMELFVRGLAMLIFYYFWHAVYAEQNSIGGLELQQTINYIMLTQSLGSVIGNGVLWMIGYWVREGMISIELMRPLDFQARVYAQELGGLFTAFTTVIPLLLLAVLAFGLQLPADPLVWLCYLISTILGHAVMFLFMWIVACLTFYITEVWGLGVLMWSLQDFFSGALIPLVMLPTWLQTLAAALPFGQSVFVPISILSGVMPLSAVPSLWLVQAAWIVGLLFASRFVFSRAVRKVTVQGG